MVKDIHMLIREDFSFNGFVFSFLSGEGEHMHKAKPIEMVPHTRGEYLEPAGVLSHGATQELFDSLWKQGFRPKDGTGNSGHIAAVQYHLEDMRKIAFDKSVETSGGQHD